MSAETLATQALKILHDWVQSQSLRKHSYAVADSMKHFAQLRGEGADLWEAVGLLHDMDYERHPNLERSATEGHPFGGVAWLRDHGWSEEVCRAILSHADYTNVSRESSLEKTLYAVDELSGFIVAVALVRPGRKPRRHHSRRRSARNATRHCHRRSDYGTNIRCGASWPDRNHALNPALRSKRAPA